jgi:ribosomal protein S12 methylthiotransferase accessory factor
MAGALHSVNAGGNAMAESNELFITLDGNRRVTAHVGGHQIRTDQPVSNGGDNSAPSPFDVFLGSIGACAGIFVQGFCAARGIDFTGIRICESPHYDAQGILSSVELAIDLPADFPVRYQEPLLRAVEQCSVKRAIAARPEFVVRLAAIPAAAVVVAHP